MKDFGPRWGFRCPDNNGHQAIAGLDAPIFALDTQPIDVEPPWSRRVHRSGRGRLRPVRQTPAERRSVSA